MLGAVLYVCPVLVLSASRRSLPADVTDVHRSRRDDALQAGISGYRLMFEGLSCSVAAKAANNEDGVGAVPSALSCPTCAHPAMRFSSANDQRLANSPQALPCLYFPCHEVHIYNVPELVVPFD